MKDIFKTDLFLKIAVITGFAALLVIFFSSKGETVRDIDENSKTENQLISMISMLCEDKETKVVVRTDKDGFTVIGVGIVTESAKDPVIKEKILELTSKILDVSPARICVTI
ncbi:MAG: hypothetical protein IJ045_01290 [Ruminiclostridium sp.]|nr:hypothetical protein [Ruminiclostridium sp.]